jgi:hypothetical protein
MAWSFEEGLSRSEAARGAAILRVIEELRPTWRTHATPFLTELAEGLASTSRTRFIGLQAVDIVPNSYNFLTITCL